MLHPNLQAEYFNWIRSCIQDRSAIGPFCDWLDENKIRSQQWREILAFMNKVKYFKIVERKQSLWASFVTAHKVIDIRLTEVKKKSYQISLSIRNRTAQMTNAALERQLSLFTGFNYQKVCA
jgi:hypothetical protein